MNMRSASVKNAGYLLSLLPQLLLVVGTYLHFPWLSVLFFFCALPILRKLIGNDLSQPVERPSRWLAKYLAAVPRLYCAVWATLLPWTVWILATMPMTTSQYIGFVASLWIVCSLNTAVAHELIHSLNSWDRTLGGLLDASVGYFHFAEEHFHHHARTGHYYGGDSAIPGTTIYKYAVTRYAASLASAWQYETSRLLRKKLSWRSNLLLRKAPLPLIIAAIYYTFAGGTGLGIYLFEVMGTAFTVQAITYLQHWGLSEKETPSLADFGFAWEDGCWMQACVTLNHAYHGQHHLNLRRPYFQLALAKGGLLLPASYPVMFVVALFPPIFTHVMGCRLATWINNHDLRDAMWHSSDCIGAVRLVEAIRKRPEPTGDQSPVAALNELATAKSAAGDKSSRNISGDRSISG